MESQGITWDKSHSELVYDTVSSSHKPIKFLLLCLKFSFEISYANAIIVGSHLLSNAVICWNNCAWIFWLLFLGNIYSYYNINSYYNIYVYSNISCSKCWNVTCCFPFHWWQQAPQFQFISSAELLYLNIFYEGDTKKN